MDDTSDDPILMIIIVVVVLVVAVWRHHIEKKRREAMARLAAELGLKFDAKTDRELAKRHNFLDQMAQGGNRYAFNVISGQYQGYPVVLFDYHYQTTSGIGKKKQTNHYYFSFFVLHMTTSFPELTIAEEGFWSKVGQALGHDDIDFESHEFSKRYVVRCDEKRFAYDFCNAQMIEYLLDKQVHGIEVENQCLGLRYESKMPVELIEKRLNHLLKIRSLMPTYLFDD
jgi:hypothetical protein